MYHPLFSHPKEAITSPIQVSHILSQTDGRGEASFGIERLTRVHGLKESGNDEWAISEDGRDFHGHSP